jgi:hypothetical protein
VGPVFGDVPLRAALCPEVAVAFNHEICALVRSLARSVTLLVCHPELPLVPSGLSVSIQSSSQPQFLWRDDPNRVGQVRRERLSRRRDAFHDQEFIRPKIDPSPILACLPLRALKADHLHSRDGLEDFLDQLWPPVDWILPTGEVVGMNDVGSAQCDREALGEAALAGAAESVYRNDSRRHPLRRLPRTYRRRNLRQKRIELVSPAPWV